MATETTQMTSPVQVRGVTQIITAGVVAAAVAGSIMLTGNTHTDRAANTAPTQYLGTGSYMTYVDTICTNTGGNSVASNSRSCYIANPFSGTGVIVRAQVDTNKAPGASKITCVTTPIGNVYGTGTSLIKYAATFSGSTVIGSGGILGVGPYTPPVILPGAGVRCWHSPGGANLLTPGLGLKEQLRLWVNQQYIP